RRLNPLARRETTPGGEAQPGNERSGRRGQEAVKVRLGRTSGSTHALSLSSGRAERTGGGSLALEWGSSGWSLAVLGILAQIDGWVPIEEIVRPQLEGMPDGWHHRQIFSARQVVHAHVDPDHDVLIADGPIARGPCRQAVAASALKHVFAP